MIDFVQESEAIMELRDQSLPPLGEGGWGIRKKTWEIRNNTNAYFVLSVKHIYV